MVRSVALSILNWAKFLLSHNKRILIKELFRLSMKGQNMYTLINGEQNECE